MRQIVDTTSMSANAKFDAWREAVCGTFLNADACLSTPGAKSEFWLSSRSLSNTLVGMMDAPQHIWTRSRALIRKDDDATCCVAIPVQGETRYRQNGHDALLQPGDMVIYTGALPLETQIGGRILLMSIPRDIFQARVSRSQQLFGKRIDRSRPMVSLLGTLMKDAEATELTPAEAYGTAPRLSNAILDILSMIWDVESGGFDAVNVAQPLERVIAYARANLGNESLSPEELAQAGCISVRTLNRQFAQLGVTPMRWIWQERLRESRTMLETQRIRSVTEVAFNYGFKDTAHFSRSFKQAFGKSPREIRDGAS